jgi:hypothetical protein
MATTYTLIDKAIVGSGGAASISFTSIPSTYTDLCVKVSSRTDATDVSFGLVAISFNGVTTNLSSTILYGFGSGSGSLSTTGAPSIWSYTDTAVSTNSTFSNSEFFIGNYAGSNFKSVSVDGVNENNATDGRQNLTAGLWSNTSAITSVQLTPFDSNNVTKNFVQYSTAYLYGIKNS